MVMRLAFSMFAALEPDVFIVDEALSVGDIFFQQKCVRRINQLRERGTTLLFVSHDLGAVQTLCDKVLVLHHGRQEHFGDKIKGIQLYYALSGAAAGQAEQNQAPPPQAPGSGGAAGKSDAARGDERAAALGPMDEIETARLPWQAPDETDKVGDDSIRIEAICLRRDDGEFTHSLEHGRDLDIFVRLRAAGDVGPVSSGLFLYDRFHQLMFAQGWMSAQLQPLWLKENEVVVARFRVRMDLEWDQEYILSLGASQPLSDPESPTGWNQNVGGKRYVLLPRCARIRVLPRSDGTRRWFGPANLRTSHQRKIIPAGDQPLCMNSRRDFPIQ
jgi:energy-coupling factor transporter ATP-binding protein EcfA2